MSIERVSTNPAAGFADAVTTVGSGRTIYVSGNVGFGPEGKVVDGGMGAEARATFETRSPSNTTTKFAPRNARWARNCSTPPWPTTMMRAQQFWRSTTVAKN